MEQIRIIDSDDNLYVSMLNKAPVLSPQDPDAICKFLLNIMSQSVESSRRRPENGFASRSQEIIKRHLWYENSIQRINGKIKNEIRKKEKGII